MDLSGRRQTGNPLALQILRNTNIHNVANGIPSATMAVWTGLLRVIVCVRIPATRNAAAPIDELYVLGLTIAGRLKPARMRALDQLLPGREQPHSTLLNAL